MLSVRVCTSDTTGINTKELGLFPVYRDGTHEQRAAAEEYFSSDC